MEGRRVGRGGGEERDERSPAAHRVVDGCGWSLLLLSGARGWRPCAAERSVGVVWQRCDRTR